MRRQAVVWIVPGVAVVVATAAALYWWQVQRAHTLPAYIVRTNGRLEFARIDIAVKNPGRIVALSVHEGERVAAGQTLARQDDAELNAQLAGARAQRAESLGSIDQAQAELKAHQSGEALAKLEETQTEGLYHKKLVSDVELQRRELTLRSATAAVAAAAASLTEAKTALEKADADISRLEVQLGETLIKTPVGGRIEYKVIENGAVLPPGGRVATLLDPTDVYMTVFLGSKIAGKLRVGDEARIVLDGLEGQAIPAKVSFISPEAQFTPKFVETASERDKLVYRIKLQIPPALAAQYEGLLKAGATGNGYVRLQEKGLWPRILLAGAKAQGTPE